MCLSPDIKRKYIEEIEEEEYDDEQVSDDEKIIVNDENEHIKIIAESDKDSDEENAKVPPLRGNDSRSNRMLQINMMTKKSADNATQSFAGALSQLLDRELVDKKVRGTDI